MFTSFAVFRVLVCGEVFDRTFDYLEGLANGSLKGTYERVVARGGVLMHDGSDCTFAVNQ